MSKHAVVLAGDTRTWIYSVKTLSPFLEDADIYVSVWSESNYSHHVSKEKFSHHPLNEASVRQILAPFVPTSVCIEDHDSSRWARLGYNSNYLHRLRTGVDMVRRSGIEYRSVTLMRPDLFFGPPDNEFVQDLLYFASSSEKGQVVTVMSQHLLNDWLLAVHPDDMDKIIPTVEHYGPHKHEDWHTYHRNFVAENGMQIVDIQHVPVLILRPPTHEGITYEDAYRNTRLWNSHYIIHLINTQGIKAAIRAWGPSSVQHAVEDLITSGSWKEPPI
jgi:hypothetical protein